MIILHEIHDPTRIKHIALNGNLRHLTNNFRG